MPRLRHGRTRLVAEVAADCGDVVGNDNNCDCSQFGFQVLPQAPPVDGHFSRKSALVHKPASGVRRSRADYSSQMSSM
jgi:hypothetical protein